jgi:AraC-like DNA-binding protein
MLAINMKKENTKEKIIQHIEKKLVHKKSYNICMTTVAKELKMSKRTIYEIFESKDEIFENIVLRFHTNVKKVHDKIIADVKNNEISVYAGIEEFIKAVFKNRYIAHSKIFDKFPKHSEKIKLDTHEFLNTLLEIAKKRKIIREDLNKRAFYFVLGSVVGTIIMKYEIDLDMIAEMNEILCYGIFVNQPHSQWLLDTPE